jgi:hypothetical protein
VDEFFKWALSGENLSVPGVLLVNLIVLALGLHRQWLVPGWVHRDMCKERDEARAALSLRNAEDRASVANLQEKVSELTEALMKRQERRQRRDQ